MRPVSDVGGDQAISIYPFLWAKGEPIEKRHHGIVPIAEMFSLNISG